MICDQRDPAGWVPYCGQDFDPAVQWAICPHPRITSPIPVPAMQFEAAWETGWRPPDYSVSPTLTTSLDSVVEVASRLLGQTVRAVKGPRRDRPLVHHRQVAFAVCRRVTDCSLPTIAKAFNRDHTTVMHGIRQAESDPKLRTLVDRIAAQISGAEVRA